MGFGERVRCSIIATVSDSFGTTLSIAPAHAVSTGELTEPVLVLAFECGRPTAGAIRIRLGHATTVIVGRGPTRSVTVEGATITIRVPDRWMSSQHARLEASFGRWVLTDTESKNGSQVDGLPQKRAVLTDCNLLELGHTLFWYFGAFEMPADTAPITEVVPGTVTPSAAGSLDPGAATTLAPRWAAATLAPRWAAEWERLTKVAQSDIPVLLEGESGSGKEVVARAIAAQSGRTGAFVPVNCGALAPQLIESELFGHRRGAFSGAVADHLGLIRAADGGTLFLDEIGDLPAPSQAALLRVLQEHEVTPVGGVRPVAVQLRVIAATHRDLDEMVAAGTFRHDLLARLAGFRCEVPALHERRCDIGIIMGALFAQLFPAQHLGFELDCARALLRYPWPLNIRELEQTLSTAQVLAGTSSVSMAHLPESVRTGRPPGAPKPIELNEIDRKIRDEVEVALRDHLGNISAVARALNKDRKQIQRWVKRFGLDPLAYR